jgi:hypothetical protein
MERDRTMKSNRNRKRSDIRVDAVFDIETHRWDQFVAGGILRAEGDTFSYDSFDWEHEGHLVDAILEVRGDVWAHNGGKFDAKWFADHLIGRGIQFDIVPSGSRIAILKIPKQKKWTDELDEIGPLRILDSYALAKQTLRDFSQGLGVQKSELGLACLGPPACDIEECEGYCRISRDMSEPDRLQMMEYLHADCESLYLALQALREFAADNDLDLAPTIGSAAYKTVRRWTGLKDSDLSLGEAEYLRRAYFGGRVQVIRPHAEMCWEYDVNSMYPAMLCKPVPVGDRHSLYGGDAESAFMDKRRPGIYSCRVRVAKTHLPPLPYRTPDRVSYPTGDFEGTWTLPELLRAQVCGASILSISRCMVWDDEAPIFKPWAERLFAIRDAAPGGKSGPLGSFVKFDLNSVTGKLGARPDNERIEIDPSPMKDCPCDCGVLGDPEIDGPVCDHSCTAGGTSICDRTCGHHYPLFPGGPIYGAMSVRVGASGHTHIAAYLTSMARVEWHEQAISLDGQGWDIVYGDTDSIFAVAKHKHRVTEGNALGMWKFKGPATAFNALAPKVYTFRRDGEWEVRSKGLRLPRDTEKAHAMLDIGVPLPAIDGIWGLKRGAREGKFFRTNKGSRVIGGGFGDRIKDPDVPWTRAPTIEEVLDPVNWKACKKCLCDDERGSFERCQCSCHRR